MPFRGNGPQRIARALIFPRQVIQAVAGIQGYSLVFQDEDHEVGLLEVRLDVEINANVVEVRGELGLRDWSGNWDDNYSGVILVAVLAEIESVSELPPRGDLIITGVETTQAVQSFRSAKHLDAANVLPDNAIPLVSGKATGLRLWVDYDTNAGLPVIEQLTGEVVALRGAQTATLTPLRSIEPRPETEIDRGESGHTLNFRMPEVLCQGTVQLECRVFDESLPTQRSAAFRPTLHFVDISPLGVYGVGIHYLGQGLDLPPPDAIELLNTLDWARQTFPTGDISLTGFTTVEFDEDMRDDGLRKLLAVLREMRGDSDDIFIGLLPEGITFRIYNGAGELGVATFITGYSTQAAHELGHALGRKHAPCDNPNRCKDPGGEDSDYPHYGAFVSDSIGEYGFNPLSGVYNPANTYDMMGYSQGVHWLSPYTYLGLFARMGRPSDAPPQYQANRAAYRLPNSARLDASTRKTPSDRLERPRVKVDRLHLNIEVARDRTVTAHPSFAFAAAARLGGSAEHGFTVEVLDIEGAVMSCGALVAVCTTCRDGCWPRRLIGEIPLNCKRAASLAVYEGSELIYSAEIAAAPIIRCDQPTYLNNGDVKLSWHATSEGSSDANRAELTYIVQWEDEEGTWRGLAPPSEATSARVPSGLLLGRQHVCVRVLATTGLSTGLCEIEIGGIRSDPPVDVAIIELDGLAVRAYAVDHLGRTMPNAKFIWYDDRGAEISRGAELDLRTIPSELRKVRVVALNVPAGKGERRITVHRRDGGARLGSPDHVSPAPHGTR